MLQGALRLQQKAYMFTESRTFSHISLDIVDPSGHFLAKWVPIFAASFP